MNYPSISEAFRKSDGMSFGHLVNLDSDSFSFSLYSDTSRHSIFTFSLIDENRRIYSKGVYNGNSKVVFNNGNEQSKENIRQLLITRPICRVYYESNYKYGYYKNYRYIVHDRVDSVNVIHE